MFCESAKRKQIFRSRFSCGIITIVKFANQMVSHDWNRIFMWNKSCKGHSFPVFTINKKKLLQKLFDNFCDRKFETKIVTIDVENQIRVNVELADYLTLIGYRIVFGPKIVRFFHQLDVIFSSCLVASIFTDLRKRKAANSCTCIKIALARYTQKKLYIYTQNLQSPLRKKCSRLQGIFLWTVFAAIFIYLLRLRGRRTVPKLFAPPILKIKVWPIAIHGWHFGVSFVTPELSVGFWFFLLSRSLASAHKCSSCFILIMCVKDYWESVNKSQ